MNRFILLLLIILSIVACKKDPVFEAPKTPDYSGVYYFKGDAEQVTTNGVKEALFYNNVLDNNGHYFQLSTDFYSEDGYKLYGNKLQADLYSKQFAVYLYGGPSSSFGGEKMNASDLQKALVKDGGMLSFGKAFGNLRMELVDPVFTSARLYETVLPQPDSSYAMIESVTDVRYDFAVPPAYASIVKFRFKARFSNSIDPNLPEVQVRNGEASVLFVRY